MKKKINVRSTAFMLAVLMVLGLFSACGSSTPNATTTPAVTQTATESTVAAEATPTIPAEKKLVRFLMPGDASPDNQMVVDAINQKMEQDGVYLTLEEIYISWDAWEQKTNLMMATGEPFEIIQVMEDWISSASMAAKGGIVPIGAAYLDKYGPNLKKAIPDWAWEYGKINNMIYVVPAFDSDSVYREGFITYRKDLFDKHGLSVPNTPDELITAMDTITKAEAEQLLTFIPDDSVMENMLNRWYDSYPFMVSDGMILVGNDGTVKSYVESEEFKKTAAFGRELYNRGLVPTDILNYPDDKKENIRSFGKFAIMNENGLSSWPQQHTNNPEMVTDIFLPSPEKPITRYYGYFNSNAFSATSPNPEAGVEFFNWLYANQENYDLLHYGIKDTHWKDMGDGAYEILNRDNPTYNYSSWMSYNATFARHDSTIHPIELQLKNNQYPGVDASKAVNFINFGFKFDPKPVTTEFANCQAELLTSFLPIKYGVVDYEKDYASALTRLKAAGIDKVVAEYDTQLKAWLALKK